MEFCRQLHELTRPPAGHGEKKLLTHCCEKDQRFTLTESSRVRRKYNHVTLIQSIVQFCSMLVLATLKSSHGCLSKGHHEMAEKCIGRLTTSKHARCNRPVREKRSPTKWKSLPGPDAGVETLTGECCTSNFHNEPTGYVDTWPTSAFFGEAFNCHTLDYREMRICLSCSVENIA